jgi:hypothetical protein
VAAPHAESSGSGSVGGWDSGQPFNSLVIIRRGSTPIALAICTISTTDTPRVPFSILPMNEGGCPIRFAISRCDRFLTFRAMANSLRNRSFCADESGFSDFSIVCLGNFDSNSVILLLF